MAQGYNNQSRGSYGGGRGYGNDRRNNYQQREEQPAKPHVKLGELDYVDRAEEVMKSLDNQKLSTSKIRNLLSMISGLYDEVRRTTSDTLSDEMKGQIQYIRMHFAYEAGRDDKVKAFVKEADILGHIKDIGDSRKQFLLFCRYMEALVAYHRYYGGKE